MGYIISYPERIIPLKMKTSLFNYQLPKNLIANSPAKPRDSSRLMVIDRFTDKISHYRFSELEKLLGPNDVLVLNKTRVFPARLFGKKTTGGKVEVLLHKNIDKLTWEVLTKPGLKAGQEVSFKGCLLQIVKRKGETSVAKFDIPKDLLIKRLQKIGITPLPPYIHSGKTEKDLRREYQTIYARSLGSVAAPTAGFHFTKSLLSKLKTKGIQIEYVTLHVGLGTFAPVKTQNIESHPMHYEYFEAEPKAIERLNRAKKVGKRIVVVGTTTTRVLETLANKQNRLRSGSLRGNTNLFVYPLYKFKFVDALITNFHLPKSTLLCLVSAFVSYPNTKKGFKNFNNSLMGKAYMEAKVNKYRFYSFGDACFIT